jgi:integrase/recombinase XerD
MTRPAAAEPTFGTLLQDFFCLRLQEQRGASPNTVASYRDTFRLLLQFAAKERGLAPTHIVLADLDAPLVLAFLHHLEHERGNCPRTRNVRLAAIRAFFGYAGLRVPTALAAVQRVAAIPFKRFDRPEVGYLTRPEVEALLAAPLAATWIGQRDRTLFRTSSRRRRPAW